MRESRVMQLPVGIEQIELQKKYPKNFASSTLHVLGMSIKKLHKLNLTRKGDGFNKKRGAIEKDAGIRSKSEAFHPLSKAF